MSNKRVEEALKKPFPIRDKIISKIEVFGITSSTQAEKIIKSINFTPDDKTAIIVFDVIRCSTTILSAFAQGAKAVSVVDKSKGLDESLANSIGNELNLSTVTGGELFGKPVPGGVIRNSPTDIKIEKIKGKHLYFLSSNLGVLLENIVNVVGSKDNVEIILGAYPNIDKVAKYLKKFNRFIIIAAGLKGDVAIEDIHFGGKLISVLKKEEAFLNAEAHVMLAVYKGVDDINVLTKKTPTGKLLKELGMYEDLDSCLNPETLPETIKSKMEGLLPIASIINGVTVFQCI